LIGWIGLDTPLGTTSLVRFLPPRVGLHFLGLIFGARRPSRVVTGVEGLWSGGPSVFPFFLARRYIFLTGERFSDSSSRQFSTFPLVGLVEGFASGRE